MPGHRILDDPFDDRPRARGDAVDDRVAANVRYHCVDQLPAVVGAGIVDRDWQRKVSLWPSSPPKVASKYELVHNAARRPGRHRGQDWMT
jgi:hypothetical protein